MDNILTAADQLVHGDRFAQYGSPIKSLERIAAMWTAVVGTTVSPVQVGLMMVCLKVCRECTRHQDDNLVDIAGYAEVINMALEEINRAT